MVITIGKKIPQLNRGMMEMSMFPGLDFNIQSLLNQFSLICLWFVPESLVDDACGILDCLMFLVSFESCVALSWPC